MLSKSLCLSASTLTSWQQKGTYRVCSEPVRNFDAFTPRVCCVGNSRTEKPLSRLSAVKNNFCALAVLTLRIIQQDPHFCHPPTLEIVGSFALLHLSIFSSRSHISHPRSDPPSHPRPRARTQASSVNTVDSKPPNLFCWTTTRYGCTASGNGNF